MGSRPWCRASVHTPRTIAARRPHPRLVFLGTGASGGTPGLGRSQRAESSVLLEASTSLLLDATRHVTEQLHSVRALDAVLLTHGHRDATGGIPRLRQWWQERCREPLPVFGHAKTLRALERRYARLDHCRLIPVSPGRAFRFREWRLAAIEVPHSRDREVPTFAWRIGVGSRRLVYASDVASPEPRLERFAGGADVLIVDGATYGRRIFSHLRIDEDLPRICGWDVGEILLTQIGRSAPPHEELQGVAERLCCRARPAFDGLVMHL
jgi:phosphoribosyl 1,2-cyclic phosphodiesterase